jgi:hypothetical protein
MNLLSAFAFAVLISSGEFLWFFSALPPRFEFPAFDNLLAGGVLIPFGATSGPSVHGHDEDEWPELVVFFLVVVGAAGR